MKLKPLGDRLIVQAIEDDPKVAAAYWRLVDEMVFAIEADG